MVTKIKLFVGTLLALIALGTVLVQFESQYEKKAYAIECREEVKDEINYLSLRLDLKLIQDRMNNIDEQMYEMRKRTRKEFVEQHGRQPRNNEELIQNMSEEDRKKYRELEKEYRDLEKKKDKILEKQEPSG